MSSSADASNTGTPDTVRWAAAALGAYAVIVVGFATVSQMQTDWEAAASYPRALVRAGGVGLVTWGILQRARWAWWLAIGLSGFWVVGGIAGLSVLFNLGGPEATSVLPNGFLAVMSVTTVLLVAAIVLLCLPKSRAAFKTTKTV